MSAIQNEQIHSDLHKIGVEVQFCHQNALKNHLNSFLVETLSGLGLLIIGFQTEAYISRFSLLGNVFENGENAQRMHFWGF
jgi:hypothetical protein